MRVLGISGISNMAIDQADSPGEASHEEVLEAGQLLAPRMTLWYAACWRGCELLP